VAIQCKTKAELRCDCPDIEGEWYFMLNTCITDFDTVDSVIREGGRINLLAVCSHLSASLDDSVTSPDFFEQLVRSAAHIIVEVYDGEGYLVCTFDNK
jgi:hypothetical protein